MLRQSVAQGLGSIIFGPKQCHAVLWAAGTRELSGQGNLSVGSANSLLPSLYQTSSQLNPSLDVNKGLRRLPPRPIARLEIWRHNSTAWTAVMAPRPAIFVSSVSSKIADLKVCKLASASTASKAKTASLSKTKASHTKVAAVSRASGTVRGRAVAERRRAAPLDVQQARAAPLEVQQARAAAKARAAAAIAKTKAVEKARTDKLLTRIKARVTKLQQEKAEAIAKVRAEAKEKLQAVLEKLQAAKGVKRSPSALNLYVREQYKANSSLTLKEINQRFKALSVEEKEKYVSQATAAKAEMSQRKRRVISAFEFFCSEQRQAVAAVIPGGHMVEVVRRLAETWRSMGSEQRLKYVEMSEADRKAKARSTVTMPKLVSASASIGA